MPRIIPSGTLVIAAKASEEYEKAEALMRKHWPNPPKALVKKWNEARRDAEKLTALVGRAAAL